MKNWARNVIFNPSKIAEPSSEEAIQEIILKTGNEKKEDPSHWNRSLLYSTFCHE